MVRSKGQELKHLPTTSHLFFPRLNFTPSFPAVLPFPQSRPAQRVRTGAVLGVWQRSCAAPSPLHCSLLTMKPCSGAWSTFPRALAVHFAGFPCVWPFLKRAFPKAGGAGGAQPNPGLGTSEPAGMGRAQPGQPRPLRTAAPPASTSPPAPARGRGKEHSLFFKAREVGQIWKGCSCLDTLS